MTENHKIVGDPNKDLAASMVSKIKPLPSSKCSIFRVPKKLRRVKEEAYVPEIVSIGPLHRGNPNLQPMEQHKTWYLHSLISRSSTPDTLLSTMEEFVKSIRDIETICRGYYHVEPTTDPHLSSDEFVQMMLLDGCFILELFHRDVEESSRNNNNNNNNNNNTDPIFSIAWKIFSIQHDLILFENQIPFIVLHRLFSLTTRKDPEQGRRSLNQLVLDFFAAMIPKIRDVQKGKQNSSSTTKLGETTTQGQGQGQGQPKHLLDLLRSQLLPSEQQTEDAGHSSIWEFTHCVTDLWEAGVTFKRKEAADGLLDIKFKDGVFEIPPFFFDESTDVLLRNLVAMEQCDGNSTSQITSYVLLLDILINSEKDVRLLCHKKIIHSYLADDEEMAVFINSICKGVSINKFYYDGVCNRANEYFKQVRHKWRATLKRDYFNTPWAILSFIGAVILLLLTFIQTLFAGLSYNHSPNGKSS